MFNDVYELKPQIHPKSILTRVAYS
jgi:hypothetical protein